MSGRSRGRARIRTEGQNPPAPGVLKPTPTLEPPAPVVPEVGRGRGLTTTPTTPQKPKEESKLSNYNLYALVFKSNTYYFKP